MPRILAAARAAGVTDFQLFGEVFITDAIELSSYVRDRGLPNVLDFPLQDALARFAGGSAGADGHRRTRLEDDDYFARPTASRTRRRPSSATTTSGRAALQVQRRRGARAAPLLAARCCSAYDLLYLLRGAPVVYYGDEVGIVGSGGDKEARQDMFPTQVAEWQTQERVGSAADRQRLVVRRRRPPGRGAAAGSWARSALRTRRSRPARRSCARAQGRARGQPHRRRGRSASTSRSSTRARPARVTVATATPRAEWTPLLGAPPASSARERRADAHVPAYSSALLAATRQIPRGAAAKPVLKVGARQAQRPLARLRDRAARAPVSVAFAVRRDGKRWTRIAADDSPPYRAFLDPAKFRRGERVYLVAIARGLDGRTAARCPLHAGSPSLRCRDADARAPEPYDFDLSTARYRAFGPDLANLWHEGGVHRVVDGREVRIESAPCGVDVEPLDAATEPLVAHYLGAPFDLDGFYSFAESDRVLARLVHQLRGLRPPLNPDPYETLVTSITAQQVSLYSAFAVRNRLIERFGVQAGHAWAFPTQERLAAADEEELTELGFSRRKAEYVIGIARADVDWGELAQLARRRGQGAGSSR